MPQRCWACLAHPKCDKLEGGVHGRGGRENKDGGVTVVKTDEGEKVKR